MKNVSDITAKLSDLAPVVKRYLPALFCVLVLGVYGFLVYRVQVLNNENPSTSDLTAQSQVNQVPHIDQSVISQLKTLQDNSVSVQSLFSGQGRSNPFDE